MSVCVCDECGRENEHYCSWKSICLYVCLRTEDKMWQYESYEKLQPQLSVYLKQHSFNLITLSIRQYSLKDTISYTVHITICFTSQVRWQYIWHWSKCIGTWNFKTTISDWKVTKINYFLDVVLYYFNLRTQKVPYIIIFITVFVNVSLLFSDEYFLFLSIMIIIITVTLY